MLDLRTGSEDFEMLRVQAQANPRPCCHLKRYTLFDDVNRCSLCRSAGWHGAARVWAGDVSAALPFQAVVCPLCCARQAHSALVHALIACDIGWPRFLARAQQQPIFDSESSETT
jgi:hypothetical protein